MTQQNPIEPERIMPPEMQLAIWLHGESVHNGLERGLGECCPDFSCCVPAMQAPYEEREAFVAMKDEERTGMLGMMLGRMVAEKIPDVNIHLSGFDKENT